MPADRVLVVRQGDHLRRLAFLHGFDPDEVWNDPKNAELRALRGDGNILMPGDVLRVPKGPRKGLPFEVGTTNRYRAKVPVVETVVRLVSDEGPIANEPYVVEGLGAPVEGTTDADGKLTIEHRVTERGVMVWVPGRGRCFPLRFGDMDPITEVSGVQKRLGLLGHFGGEATGALDEATTEAITAFQKKQGLPANGQLDEATRAALKEAFGC